MDSPYSNLTEEQIGDLHLLDEEQRVNTELYAYLRAMLIELQRNFMRSLKERTPEQYAKLMFDGLMDWAEKISPFEPVLATRLQKAALVAKTIYAIDASDEFAPGWSEPINLRSIYSPIVEACMCSLRHRVVIPFGVGAFTLGMRDAFIDRQSLLH